MGELHGSDAMTATNALNQSLLYSRRPWLNFDSVFDTTPIVTSAVVENENDLSWLFNDLTDVIVVDISVAKLDKLQKEDRTLDKLFNRVTNKNDCDNDENFLWFVVATMA